MKKYIIVSFIFAFALLGLGVTANAANCAPGDLFSSVTGQPCSATASVVSCPAGDVFSSITGQRCNSWQGNSSNSFGGVVSNLTIGSRGNDVRAIQQILKNENYSMGTVDGIFGPRTARAIREFQEDNSLPVTGNVDVATRAVLNGFGTIPAQPGTLVVIPPASSNLNITTDSLLPFDAQVGQANWKASLAVSGIPSGYNSNNLDWSVSSGSLPPGLYLSASDGGEIITGAPTQAGTFYFSLTATTASISRSNPNIAFASTTKQFTAKVNPVTTTFPSGCTSSSGYSLTTGQACDGTTQVVGDRMLITYPSQGTNWVAGTAYMIRWTNYQDPHTPKVFMTMTKSDGTGRINITNQSGGYFPYLGNGMWADPQVKIPENISPGNYKVFLTDIAGGTRLLSDVVNVTVSASVTPSITVLSPNGGETWTAGYINQLVTFSTNLPIGTRYEVALVGTGYDSALAYGTVQASDKQAAYIQVPNVLGSFRVRVMGLSTTGSCSGASCIQDQSDSNFTITVPITSTLPPGCTSSSGFSWTTGAPCDGSTTPLAATCVGEQSGDLSIKWNSSVGGGTAPYSYSWNVYNDVTAYTSGNTVSPEFSARYSSAGGKQAVIRVTDASGVSTSAPCSGTITATASSMFSITNSSPLPNAKVGNSYRVVLGVDGGPSGISTGNYNWSVSSGSLPSGLYLTASDFGEIITGTPTVAGIYFFALRANYGSYSGSTTLALTVDPAQTVAKPSISSISPSSGGSNQVVNVYGTGFTQSSIVLIGDNVLTSIPAYVSPDGTNLRFMFTTLGLSSPATMYSIRVSNVGNVSVASNLASNSLMYNITPTITAGPTTTFTLSSNSTTVNTPVILNANTVSPSGTLQSAAIDQSSDNVNWTSGAPCGFWSSTNGYLSHPTSCSFTPTSAGTYYFRSRGTDANGASSFVYQTLTVTAPVPVPMTSPILSTYSWYADDPSTWPTVSTPTTLTSNQAMRVKGLDGSQYFNKSLGVNSGKITSSPVVGTGQLILYIWDYGTNSYATSEKYINVSISQ